MSNTQTPTPTKTKRPTFHEPYRTVKCACGAWITEKWDFHRQCWTTDHQCLRNHPANS